MLDLSSLNANQLNAVNWTDGPLLVLAGPGSGKTRILTYRIARIIETTPDRPFRILGLTFTNTAAFEMKTRIEQLVPNARNRTLLTTFHSFCADILRQHGHHVGLRPDFAILPQNIDRISVLDDAIAAAIRVHPHINQEGEQLLPMVSRLLGDCISPDDALPELKKRGAHDAEALATIYSNYRRSMVENNRLDFDCLIAEALNLLENNAAVRRLIRRIYSYVCVDEFQDTNLAQYRVLVNLVDPSTKNLFVVADDDQIIYQWNGADPKRLDELRKEFDVSELQLPENFRCPPQVVDVANKLVRRNLTRDVGKADLIANKTSQSKGVIRLRPFRSFEDEAEWVANDIKSRPTESQADCVVLGRSRRLLEPVMNALIDNGVPSFIATRKGEFLSNQMIWLHSMLRLANARQNREQLSRICRSFFALAGINLRAPDIIADAATAEGDYLRAWQRTALRMAQLDSNTRRFLLENAPVLSEKLDFWGFVEAAFNWFDDLPTVGPDLDSNESEYLEEQSTWYDLVDEVVGEFGREQITLNVLLQGLDLRAKTPSQPEHAIPCYTIHAAKGAEFHHVYLVGLVEDQLPSWQAIKKGPTSRELQEERRNCFVAITRVQDSLTLTYSQEVFGWTKQPSRFLREMELID